MKETIVTEITKKLGIKLPILLAGMSGVAHGELAAAVSNAGGLGVIGGLTLKPKVLRKVRSLHYSSVDNKTAILLTFHLS